MLNIKGAETVVGAKAIITQVKIEARKGTENLSTVVGFEGKAFKNILDTFGDNAQALQRLKESPIGALARAPDAKLDDVVKTIFNKSTPSQVRLIKKQLNDPELFRNLTLKEIDNRIGEVIRGAERALETEAALGGEAGMLRLLNEGGFQRNFAKELKSALFPKTGSKTSTLLEAFEGDARKKLIFFKESLEQASSNRVLGGTVNESTVQDAIGRSLAQFIAETGASTTRSAFGGFARRAGSKNAVKKLEALFLQRGVDGDLVNAVLKLVDAKQFDEALLVWFEALRRVKEE